MNAKVRELIAIAERLGWSMDGYDSRGHVVLLHPNGKRMSIPSTPGEYRGIKNAIAQMERLSGRKLPRIARNRSRKNPNAPDRQIESEREKHLEAYLVRRAQEERRARAERAVAARERELADIRRLMNP